MEFYSSWFENHNLITGRCFTPKRTKQMRRNCINYVEVQVYTTFLLVKKKHLIAMNYPQSQNLEPSWPSLTNYSPNTISDDACKGNENFATFHLSTLFRSLFSNPMHSKQEKGIFPLRMLSLSILWDPCNRKNHQQPKDPKVSNFWRV